MMEKEYYSAIDIAKASGVCKTTAYKEVDNMNQELKREYPNVRIFEHRIPIWYWNLKTKRIEEENTKGNSEYVEE